MYSHVFYWDTVYVYVSTRSRRFVTFYISALEILLLAYLIAYWKVLFVGYGKAKSVKTKARQAHNARFVCGLLSTECRTW